MKDPGNLSREEQREVLEAAMQAGHILLENGAEIYRVEESVERILYAYGVKDHEVFAIPSCM